MSKSTCFKRITILVIFVLMVAVGGILLWQFLPEDSKSSLKSILNSTKPDIPEDLPSNIPGNPLNPQTPDQPNSGYQFIQCQDNDQDCCNGLASICDLRADEILYAGVHNAMAARENGFLLAPNHVLGLEKALEAGYRAINIDIAHCEDGFQLVHGRCALGSRDPTQVFGNIVDFLQSNPNQVLLLTVQIDNDAGDVEVTLNDIWNLMNAAQITNFMYSHPDQSSPWPTLRELIALNKRILFFHYNGQTCQEVACPDGFHDWFVYAAESEFSFSSVEEVRNTDTACAVSRGNVNNNFLGVNMFVTLPSKTASQDLNTIDSLQEHVQACSSINGAVNVVFVDFWSQGDLPQFVQTQNQVRANNKARQNRTFRQR